MRNTTNKSDLFGFLTTFQRRGCLGVLLFIFSGIPSLLSQELNARVEVNSSLVTGANRQLFRSLEEAMRTFVNGRSWTTNQLRTDEPINCAFTLVITEVLSASSFRGELYVQSHRPLKNSTYASPMLNVRDREMEFDYVEYQPLQFDLTFIQDNLTAAIAYYVYLIIGLDLDAHSLFGGTECFRNMEMIASNAQSMGWKGWGNRTTRGRSSIASAFNDSAQEGYRRMWYNYHRQGLAEVLPSIAYLSVLHSQRPSSILVKLFEDAKLDEVVTILAKMDIDEKKQAYESLLKLYPSRSTELERLR